MSQEGCLLIFLICSSQGPLSANDQYTIYIVGTVKVLVSMLPIFFFSPLILCFVCLLCYCQLMQGNIWLVPNAQGFPQVMALFLRFQLWRSIAVSNSEPGENSETSNSNSFFRGLQVLLADNDDVNRAVTQKLLQKLGCVVTSVSSGLECLSVIGPAGSSFQVILLDLHMPELDGFEVATRIRKFRSRNWPVIVALTASTDDLWERCMQIGMNGVIRKPVLLHGIASELRRIILQGNSVM